MAQAKKITNTKKIPDTVKTQTPIGSDELNTPEELAQELTTKSAKKVTKPKKAVTTKLISATSKVSTSLDDVWYSFSYSESREVHDDENIAEARLDLWNTVHTEVDNQVSYTIESIRGTAEPQQNVAGVPQNYGIPPEYDY